MAMKFKAGLASLVMRRDAQTFGRAISAVVGFTGLVSATGALAQFSGATPPPAVSAAQFVGQASASAPNYLTGQHDQYSDAFTNDHGGTVSGSVVTLGSASVLLNATTSQTLSINANVQPDGAIKPQGSPVSDSYSAGGTATLQYTLAVYGPTREFVPLTLRGYAQLAQTSGQGVDGASTAAALAQYGLTDLRNRNLWSVAAGSVNTFRADCENTNIVDLSGCGTSTFKSDFTVASWAGDFVGDQVNVHLYTSAGASSFAEGVSGVAPPPAGASVILDPLVEIDPVWAAAHPGFSLVFSDGIGEGAGAPVLAGGVPEPASWALMIGGFAVAGAAIRRRRTVVA
jgi:hypothetical protein